MKSKPGRPGSYGYASACDPREHKRTQYFTFSIGVFRWVSRSSGKGVKRGPVLARFTGPSDYPDELEEAARAYCDAMNRTAKTGDQADLLTLPSLVRTDAERPHMG